MRAARKRQRVSAVAAAESAGISRVTLHRIEKGEPSVAIGSWLAVATALGLRPALIDLTAQPLKAASLPDTIRLTDYPQLAQLAWQQPGVDVVSPQDALALYERNWRHVDTQRLMPAEQALIQTLAATLGAGRLLV